MDVAPKTPSNKGPAEIAMWEAPAPDCDGPETEWGELVTDREYAAR